MNTEEIDMRIQDLFEGRLNREQIAELEQELRGNEEARAIYRSHSGLHNAMMYRGLGVDLARVIPMDRLIARRQLEQFQTAMLTAAAVILIGMITLSLFLGSDNQPMLSFETSRGTEYTISHQPNPDGEEPTGQTMVPGSRLELRYGTVELSFASGVKGIIRGPADMTLRDENLLEFKHGTGWFRVPPEASGFQVTGADFTLTDLGTEFGIRSLPNQGDEVHLFEGEVEVINREGSKDKLTLKGGDARQAGPGGDWKSIELNRDHFLDKLPEAEPNPFANALMLDRFSHDTLKQFSCVDYDNGGKTKPKAFNINENGNGMLQLTANEDSVSRCTQVVHRNALLDVGQSFRTDWLTEVRGKSSISQVLTDDPDGERYKVRMRILNGEYLVDFRRDATGDVKWFNRSPYTAPETFWIDRPETNRLVWMRGNTAENRIKIAEITIRNATEPLHVGVQTYESKVYFDNMAVLREIPEHVADDEPSDDDH